jgi:hypothetical protein
LWRISDHRKMKKGTFTRRYARIYETGRFSGSDVVVAKDYVIFSANPDETYISAQPPPVASAKNGQHEEWISGELMRLTVGIAAQLHYRRRDYLRSTGRGYTHRQLTYRLPSDQTLEWRKSLISALRGSEGSAS